MRVEFERPISRVSGAAVGQQDFEEAFSANGEIVILACLSQFALAHQARSADSLDARPQFDSGWKDIALGRGLRADAAYIFVEEILEFRTLAFEASGPHVGDIVGDDLNIEFLGHHPGCCCVKCSHGLGLRL